MKDYYTLTTPPLVLLFFQDEIAGGVCEMSGQFQTVAEWKLNFNYATITPHALHKKNDRKGRGNKYLGGE